MIASLLTATVISRSAAGGPGRTSGRRSARHPRATRGCRRSARPGDVGDVERRAWRRSWPARPSVHLVRAEHGGDDLGVLLEALGEQGTQGTIHQARGEHFVVTKTAFALEEASRDLARGVRLLDVLTGSMEKSRGLALFTGHRGDQHDALTEGDEHCAVRELGQTTGLECEQDDRQY